MAEKWQQWMPLDVNDWRGSPFVRALPAAARSGYLDLILAQWDSEDCSLSSDPLDLAEASFLTAAEWAEFGPRILRKFQPLENGRLRNQVCFEKWENARAMYYKKHKPAEEVSQVRSEAGKAGNLKRWGLVANESQLRPDLSQTDRKPSQTVHIQDKNKEQRHTPKAALSSFAIPASIDTQTWADFEENRKKLRKPMTDRARKGIVDDLAKLGGDPNALLVQSITRGWAGVFELKTAFGSTGGRTNGKGDSNLAVLERVLAEDQDGAGADGDVPAGDTGRLDFKALLGTARQRAV